MCLRVCAAHRGVCVCCDRLECIGERAKGRGDDYLFPVCKATSAHSDRQSVVRQSGAVEKQRALCVLRVRAVSEICTSKVSPRAVVCHAKTGKFLQEKTRCLLEERAHSVSKKSAPVRRSKKREKGMRSVLSRGQQLEGTHKRA